MKVKVLFFAGSRDWVGDSEALVELPQGATIDSLITADELSALAPHLSSLRFALNEEFSPTSAALSDGDTVAVIPPVSGG